MLGVNLLLGFLTLVLLGISVFSLFLINELEKSWPTHIKLMFILTGIGLLTFGSAVALALTFFSEGSFV